MTHMIKYCPAHLPYEAFSRVDSECFPFVADEPEEYLKPVIGALRPFILPEKDMLELTFSSDELDSACSSLGIEINYCLLKMIRSHDLGTAYHRKGKEAE